MWLVHAEFETYKKPLKTEYHSLVLTTTMNMQNNNNNNNNNNVQRGSQYPPNSQLAQLEETWARLWQQRLEEERVLEAEIEAEQRRAELAEQLAEERRWVAEEQR